MADLHRGNTYRLGHKHTEEWKQNNSRKLKGRPSSRRGKTLSTETKAKISKAVKGIVKSPAHIKKIADALRGRKKSEEHISSMRGRSVSAGHRLKISTSLQGRMMWITSGLKEQAVYVDTQIPENWHRGRLPMSQAQIKKLKTVKPNPEAQAKRTKAMAGRIWMTDGNIDTLSPSQAYLGPQWVPGRTNSRGRSK